LIRRLRNERRIQGRDPASEREIYLRWKRGMNIHLALDCQMTNKARYEKKAVPKSLMLKTWGRFIHDYVSNPGIWSHIPLSQLQPDSLGQIVRCLIMEHGAYVLHYMHHVPPCQLQAGIWPKSGILSCNLSRIWQNKAEYGETWWNLVGMWHFMREYGILNQNVAGMWCFKPECGRYIGCCRKEEYQS
ncbi:hypothetical protein B0H10DRAFT_1793586, partial [Mycena sp. CBHHK59/15]